MSKLADLLRRGAEAVRILTSYAADMRSRKVLFGCYAGTTANPNDPTEVEFNLRVLGRVFPFRMRRMDLYTVAEVLYERQYDVRTPVPEAPVVIDGGANIGVATLWFIARYPGAQVHAFEPEPENFRLLEHNVGSITGVTCVQAAIGAHDAPVELHLAEHGAVHSVRDAAAGERTVTVPSVVLRDYLAQRDIARVHLLKLDVEGCEDVAIEGLGERLADVDIILGEMHETLVDTEALYARLREVGFHEVHRTLFHGAEQQGVHAFEVSRRPN